MFQYRYLQSLSFTIMNITEILLPIFDLIQQYEGSNIVLMLSDQNVGKTTLISSLIFGPSTLRSLQVYDPSSPE